MKFYTPNALRSAPVAYNLLIINCIMFLAKSLLDGQFPITERLAIYYFDSPFFRPWQIISYMFMHGSFAHIMFNMFALFTFGPLLEFRLSSKRFLQLFFITGIGAVLLQYGVQAFQLYHITGSVVNNGAFLIDSVSGSFSYNTRMLTPEQANTIAGIYLAPMVGASGAIFGVLTAFAVLFPQAELMLFFIPVPIKAKFLIPVYILIEIGLGVAQFSGDSIAHFAHVGGAILGFMLIKAWKIRSME